MDKFQELKDEFIVLNQHYEDIKKDTQEIKRNLNKLSGANTELGDLRQENGELRRQLGSMQTSATEFYRLMERTIHLPELSEEYKAATKKFLKDFDRYLCPHLGLTRIAPRPGEPFQEKFHQAVGDAPISSVTHDFILKVASWGFKIASWEDRGVPEIIEPSQVVIAAVPVDTLGTTTTNVVETETQQPGSETKTGDKSPMAEASQTETDFKTHKGALSADLSPPLQEGDRVEAAKDGLWNEAHSTEASTASTDKDPLKDSAKTEDPLSTAEMPAPTSSIPTNSENQ